MWFERDGKRGRIYRGINEREMRDGREGGIERW